MKKLLSLLLGVVLLVSCGQDTLATYDFYNNFVATDVSVSLTAVDTAKYKDTTKTENLPLMQTQLGLDNLVDFQLLETKSAVVANFFFSSEADHKQLETAREYAMETFWQGKVHTANILPYEDWQYSYLTKQLDVQIFCEQQLAIQDRYSFDKLTNSGDKLYNGSTAINEGVLFLGTYIYLGDYLKGSSEQLSAYTNIDSIAQLTVHTSLRENIAKDRLYVELLTEQSQINPQNLNSIYDAVVERYSFINENITIQLYVADKGMYYEYSSHIQLPQE